MGIDMFRNYLIITFRNLWRNKGYAVINLFGLAVGLAATLLIGAYILFEFSYDQFQTKRDSLYRISVISKKEGKFENDTPVYTPPIGPALKQEFPEVVDFVRLSTPRSIFVQHTDVSLRVAAMCYADSTFFNLFSFKMLIGNPQQALTQPFSIVLSQPTAVNIFGAENPVGQMVRLNQQDYYLVTGVVAAPPVNSSIQFDALVSFATLYQLSGVYLDWNGGNQYITYLQLGRHINPTQVAQKLPDFMWRHWNQQLAPIGWEDAPYLQPFSKIHVWYERFAGSRIWDIVILASIAILVLLMACTNFINLAIARAQQRIREVGIRKTLGAARKEIVKQFLTESLILSFLALILATMIVVLFFPIYQELVGQALTLTVFLNFKYVVLAIGMLVLVGILAGSYPAFYIAGFQPIQSLKDLVTGQPGKRRARNVLIVFQFTISISLLICTTLLYQQLTYLKKKELGFNKEHLLVVPLPFAEVRRQRAVLKQEFLSLPGVQGVTACSEAPLNGFTQNGYLPEGPNAPMILHVVDVDPDFCQVFEIPIVQGRNFSNEFATDKTAYLVNATLTRTLGWTNPLGKTIERNGVHSIIGEVRDFHFATLYHRIEPLILTWQPWEDQFSNLIIKIQSDRLSQTLQALAASWKKIVPVAPFDAYFLSAAFDQLYRAEQRFTGLFLAFAGLALSIALLGLYSLTAYATEQRTKEIGIRKVLGASVADITQLFSSEFLALVGLANLLAFPLAWYTMRQLLQFFAYRIQISPWVFIAIGLLTTLMALVIMSIKIIRAAWLNPIVSLRYE